MLLLYGFILLSSCRFAFQEYIGFRFCAKIEHIITPTVLQDSVETRFLHMWFNQYRNKKSVTDQNIDGAHINECL